LEHGLQIIKVGGFGGLITVTTGTNKRKNACIFRIEITFEMFPKKICEFVLDLTL